jgi:hypothetical protein
MSASIYFDLPYHQQDADNYCGLAAAQMVLASAGAAPLAQIGLVNGALVQADGITAATLAGVLNDQAMHAGLAATFASPAPYTDYDLALRAVVDNLILTGIAVPVLAFGDANHWLVVKGAVIDGPAVAGGTYTVRGLVVANPAPITAAVVAASDPASLQNIQDRYGVLPMPHASIDACGRGEDTGSKDVYISADAWRTYNWPATQDGVASTYVIVINRRTGDAAVAIDPNVKEFAPPALRVILSATSTQADVANAAQAAVRAHGLDTCPPFAAAFAGATPCRPVPLQVGTTTVRTWQYVQFVRAQPAGKPSLPAAAVFLDADGTFLGALAPPSRFIDPTDDVDLAFEALRAQRRTLTDLLGSAALAKREISIVTPRFWQPSAESLSPDRAFMRVRVRNHELIIGDDGRVYRTLTPPRCSTSPAPPPKGQAQEVDPL